MSYTPTTWIDGQLPALNDTNLNKIEQGIADAHTQDAAQDVLWYHFEIYEGDCTLEQ